MGAATFGTQMMLDPSVANNRYFMPEWVKYYNGLGWETMNRYIIVDVFPNDQIINRNKYDILVSSTCLISGTKIFLKQGIEKNIEDITVDDEVLIWNFETGMLDTTGIVFTEGTSNYKKQILYLHFTNNGVVGISYAHCLFDCDLNKFVEITPFNYRDFIGHTFLYLENNNFVRVKLVFGEIKNEKIAVYSFAPYKHFGFFANGYLNAPGGIYGIVNPYPIKEEKFTIDNEQLTEDINQYGLYSYEDFCSEIGYVPEDVFEAFNGKIYRVLMGKNIINKKYVTNLITRYQKYWS